MPNTIHNIVLKLKWFKQLKLKKTDFKFWFKIKIDLLLDSCQIERISEMFQG